MNNQETATPTVTPTPKPAASGYDGANPSIKRTHRSFTFVSLPKSEDTLTNEREKQALTLEAFALYRNNAVLRSACDKIITICLGSEGLVPQVRTGDKELDKKYESYFNKWAKSADIRGRFNFRTFQEQAILAKLLSGDMLFVKYDSYKLQAIEGERIVSPLNKEFKKVKTTAGVATDELGRIIDFYVAPRDERGNVDAKKSVKVSAENALYLANIFRPDQIRGIGVVAPVLPLLMDMDALNESVLQKAILESRLGMVTKTVTPTMLNGALPTDDATGEANPADTKLFEYNDTLNNYHLKAGAGEEVSLVMANYPGNGYIPYAQFLIQKLGAALGIPDSIILSDFSSTKITSNKVLLQQFYSTIDKHQTWLGENFVIPCWEWVIGNAILEGKLPAAKDPEAYKNVSYSIPPRLYGDPLKEVQALEKGYQLGTTSLSSNARERGEELSDILDEKESELVMAHERAMSANKKIGKDIFTHNDFISVGTKQVFATDETQPSDTTV